MSRQPFDELCRAVALLSQVDVRQFDKQQRVRTLDCPFGAAKHLQIESLDVYLYKVDLLKAEGIQRSHSHCNAVGCDDAISACVHFLRVPDKDFA